MSCDDEKRREFTKIPAGSTYSVSVAGPAGFGVLGYYDDGGNNALVKWKAADLRPGPKTQTLLGSGLVHSVYLFVTIDPTKNISVKVEATVDGKSYCRNVTGKGTEEVIVHVLRMA